MSVLFTIDAGDTGPPIIEDLFVKAADGTLSPLNLTGAANLHFQLYDAAGTLIIDQAATVVTANPARVQYAWTTPAPAAGGTYGRRWHVTLGDGSVVSIPNDVDTYPVEVSDPTVSPAAGMATCSAWCTPADVIACGACAGVAYDADVLDEAVKIASDILFLLSGSQYPGVCPDVVRPLREDSSGWWFPAVGSYSVTTGESYGAIRDNRAHDWIRDRRHLASEVLLPAYPVRAITQVRLDGVVLAPSEYLIGDDRWLIRVNGAWPCCQDVTRPATEPGTFEVSYTYGVPIPPMGMRAAAAYACEVAKACQPGAGQGQCALPPRTQQIVRQGLTVRTLDPVDLLHDQQGRTGLKIVDDFIFAVNPNGLRQRAAILSPDVDWPAIRVR